MIVGDEFGFDEQLVERGMGQVGRGGRKHDLGVARDFNGGRLACRDW